MKEKFEKLSAERCSDLEFRNTMNLASIFEEEKNQNPNKHNLYLARFGRIPNHFRLRSIDCKKANELKTPKTSSSTATAAAHRRFRRS